MGYDKSKIINYELPEDAIVVTEGSSKGTQVKYCLKDYWYKKNRWGYEGLAEVLVSEVLNCSNIKKYAQYELCKINNVGGCRSKDFLDENDSIVTLSRFYNMQTGGDMNEKLRRLDGYKERIDFTLDFVYSYTRLDIKPYLSNILTLDMLTLNDDRHLNNLAIILDGNTGDYKEAPIYDNGGSLLSSFEKYPVDDLMEDNISKVVAQPFSVNFETQANYVGVGLKIDYGKLTTSLLDYPDSRAKDVLTYQLSRYKKILELS